MTDYVIERLGHLGDGLTAEGVRVARALPGERVAGDVVDGRIAAPKIVEPVAARVKAPCPHYNACGGCAVLHAEDAFVSGWKTSVVAAALRADYHRCRAVCRGLVAVAECPCPRD